MTISLKNNPWAKNPAKNKELEEQKKVLEAMRKKALACLDNKDFKEYRDMFMQYQQTVIEDIIDLNCSDPIEYAFKVRQLVDTLKAYRLFVSSVYEDAKREVY